MWEACAEYADGTSIRKTFPYLENGNYHLEACRQYEIEEWLVTRHEDCIWWSVNYISD